MREHFPVLVVMLPLFAALFAFLVRRGAFAWFIALGGSTAATAMAFSLYAAVSTQGPIRYAIGGWAANIGIEYSVDALSAFVLVFLTAVTAIVLLAAPRSVAKEIPPDNQAAFYAMFMLTLCGLVGITVTHDLFNVFVFLEISSLATYGLIALGRNRRALMASFQYLIVGTVGATFIVLGIGMLYLMTGALNMEDVALRIRNVENLAPIYAGIAFLAVGITLKIALFPLHVWLPNAYAFAPSIASAFLAATATKVAVYLLYRVFYTVLGTAGISIGDLPVPEAMLVLSVVAIFGASLTATFQANVKRMFAFSSVGQIGYMTLGFAMTSVAGQAASLVHLFNHALMKSAAFLLIAGIAHRIGSVQMKDWTGLAYRMPWTCFGLVLVGLSLIGMPGTVGFVTKWQLATAGIGEGKWWIAALVLLSAIATFLYVGRLIETLYRKPETPAASVAVQEAPLTILVPAFALVLANVYFGLDTRWPLAAAHAAAIAAGGGP
jgi:multicomponent Na+:H+ antiporter subunit D